MLPRSDVAVVPVSWVAYGFGLVLLLLIGVVPALEEDDGHFLGCFCNITSSFNNYFIVVGMVFCVLIV